MLSFHFRVGWLALRRYHHLILIVCLIQILGISALGVSLTPWHQIRKDPAGSQGEKLFSVQLDNQAAGSPYALPGEPPSIMSYKDATALLEGWHASTQATMYPGRAIITTKSTRPTERTVRLTTAGFFPLFTPPFRYGKPWNAAEESHNVTVLSAALNEELFHGKNSVGQRIFIDDIEVTVVGVLDHWLPMPRYFDLRNGAFKAPEALFLPLAFGIHNNLRRSGSRDCWPPYTGTEAELLNSECIWLNFWAHLPTPEIAARYRRYLDNYVRAEMAQGRFPNGLNNRLRAVPEWLRSQQLLPDEVPVQALLALAFYLVCLLNGTILMSAFVSAMHKDSVVHRMLGATSAQLRAQLFTVTMMMGSIVSVGGMALVVAGLALQRHLVPDLFYISRPDSIALSATIACAFLSSALVTSLPMLAQRRSLEGFGMLKTQ